MPNSIKQYVETTSYLVRRGKTGAELASGPVRIFNSSDLLYIVQMDPNKYTNPELLGGDIEQVCLRGGERFLIGANEAAALFPRAAEPWFLDPAQTYLVTARGVISKERVSFFAGNVRSLVRTTSVEVYDDGKVRSTYYRMRLANGVSMTVDSDWWKYLVQVTT